MTIGELELELERILLEKSDVQETLVKLETVCSSLEHDKKRLKDEIKKVRPYVCHHLILLFNFFFLLLPVFLLFHLEVEADMC